MFAGASRRLPSSTVGHSLSPEGVPAAELGGGNWLSLGPAWVRPRLSLLESWIDLGPTWARPMTDEGPTKAQPRFSLGPANFLPREPRFL